MAAGDLTTLAKAKEWLGVTGSNEDALIARLITHASTRIVEEAQTPLVTTTVSQRFSGRGHVRLTLPYQPVQSVALVQVDGVTIPAATPPASGYWLEDGTLYLTGYAINRGLKNVLITYTFGYATVPSDLEQACLEMIALSLKRDRKEPGVSSKGLAGEQISLTTTALTASIVETIQNYTRVVPFD